MPALFFVIAIALYFLYMLLVRSVLRRWTWHRRSIILGEEAWYMTPMLSTIGLSLMPVTANIAVAILSSIFFPGIPSGDNSSVAPPLIIIHLTCNGAIVAMALRAQGHPFATLLPQDRRLVLKWAAFPSLLSIGIAALLIIAGPSAIPGGFGLLFISLFIFGIINASSNQQQTAKSKKPGGYLLEETPLNHELRTIFWPGPQIGIVRMLPRPKRAAEKKANKSGKQSSSTDSTPLERKIRRRLRWSIARAGVMERAAIAPIEFLHDNDSPSLTAALALRFLGWDRGYLRWRVAASPEEPTRTPAQFAIAAAHFDQYILADSATPQELFAAYRKRVPFHLFLWEHAGADKFEKSWNEIERALHPSTS